MRLSRSATAIFLFALPVAGIVIIPGQRRVTSFSPIGLSRSLRFNEELQHGWPFTYAHRDSIESFGCESNYEAIWTPWSSVHEFSVAALILDIIIALVLAGAFAGLFEWRRTRRKHFLQLHLADMFGIIAGASAVLAYLHGIYDSDLRQIRAISELKILTRNLREPKDDPVLQIQLNWSANAHTESMLPTWLDDLGILPRFRNVIGLDTCISSGENIAHLGSFRRLRYLYLCTVEDVKVDLAFLKHTPHLHVFHPPSNIDDGDARHLSHLTQLEELRLDHTPLTDAAMVHMRCLKPLRILTLPSPLSRDGLRNIEELTNLESLHLTHRMVAGDLGFLRRLTNLRELRLAWGLTEDCLADIKHL